MSGSWKVAYADFMTAMMAFFLLMWIFAATDEQTKAIIAGYFRDGGGYGNVNPDTIGMSPPPSEAPSDDVKGSSANSSSIDMENYINGLLERANLENEITVAVTEKGVLVRSPSAIMFSENDAEISDRGRKVLDIVIRALKAYKVEVIIRGYTDSVETGEPYYQSKYELSAVRSAMAAQYIIEYGRIAPEQVVSVAYADRNPIKAGVPGQPVPENRRVEFQFSRPDVKLQLGGAPREEK